MSTNKNKEYVSYSSLLIDFISPILTGQEDELEFLEKAKTGVTAWNFCVSDQAGLAADSGIKIVLEEYLKEAPKWLKEIIDKLVIRKHTDFGKYDQYILLAETRRKPDGSAYLHVESAPVSILKQMGA
jgi:hypothetical protein